MEEITMNYTQKVWMFAGIIGVVFAILAFSVSMVEARSDYEQAPRDNGGGSCPIPPPPIDPPVLDVSSGGGGSTYTEEKLSKWLIGTEFLFDHYDHFMQYLMAIFATKVELEAAHARMDLIEADGDIKGAALIKAQRTKERVEIESGWCYPSGYCITVAK
jgi:hypothetical protein